MKMRLFPMVVALSLVSSIGALAQAPSGATGQCKDGTFTTATSKKGSCADHKGVRTWFKATPSPPPTSDAPSVGSSAPTSSPSAVATPPSTSVPSTEVTPPGGVAAAQVWLNASSNVYHCPGSTYYGKTRNGAYMTEADAKSKGARPAYGKPCSVN